MNYSKKYYWSILVMLCVFGFQKIHAQNDLLQQEVTIAFENLSLKESIKKLEAITGITTALNEKELQDKKVTISFEKKLLEEVLKTLLTNENLSYKVIGNTVVIFRKEKIQTTPVISKKKANETFTINGYIMDAESQETLIGATVYISNIQKGTTSNEYGFYSLTLPKGSYEIAFSYIGFEPLVKQIDLMQNTEFSPSLSEGNQLEEVVVTDKQTTHRHIESKMSSNYLSMEKLKSIPVLMGERDVLKMVQLMPGVQSGSEGSTGLYVRGGGSDQNLILLDGVPIYNVNHLFGFLSTLNGDAIKSAEVIKGGFPARYGGRLSSILDIRMKEGNMDKFHGDLSIGLVSGKINLEGPIQKNKTSFHFSARRTWLDAITTPIQKNTKRENGIKEFNAYQFYDLNAKVNHKFSEKNRLFFSSYLGNDKLNSKFEETGYDETVNLTWGNRIFSARWNYLLSPKLFTNTTIYSSAYDFDFEGTQSTLSDNSASYETKFNSQSKIRDYGGRIDLNFLPNPNHHLRMGVGLIHHQFTPTVNSDSYQQGTQPPDVNTQGNTKINSDEIAFYVEDDMSLGKRVQLNAGLHWSNFKVETSNYTSLQPRLAFSFLLNEKSSVKLSYAQMTQFLHLLASPGLGLPTDLWVPSTDKVKPANSNQYALGYTRSLPKGFELTVEGYYKTMQNLLEYKSGFNVFSGSKGWEEKVLIGDGDSYGFEFLLEKKTGKITGWLGYTWSKSNRSFPDINNGKSFPYKYDRRHDLSLALTFKKSERMDMGLIWVYGTGNTYTLGTFNYNAIGAGQEPVIAEGVLSQFLPVNHVENRNNHRAPAYHRLDLSLNLHKMKKRGKRTWSFGFYNAYSRQNPFTIMLRQHSNGQLFLEQTSLIPIVPFATYSFKF